MTVEGRGTGTRLPEGTEEGAGRRDRGLKRPDARESRVGVNRAPVARKLELHGNYMKINIIGLLDEDVVVEYARPRLWAAQNGLYCLGDET